MTALSDFCKAENIYFRSACNEAIDSDRRPVKKRVIARLTSLDETYQILTGVAAKLSQSKAILTDEDFFAGLLADARWKTLVQEAVVGERKWLDLFTGESRDIVNGVKVKFKDKVVDWLFACMEKFFNRQEHPTATIITTAVILFTMPLVVKTISQNLYDAFTKPIRIAFTPDFDELKKGLKEFTAEDLKNAQLTINVRPTFDCDLERLKAQLDGRKPCGLPITFIDTDKMPIQVAAKVDVSSLLGNATKQVNNGTATLKAMASSLDSIQKQSAVLNSTLDNRFSTVAERLAATNDTIKVTNVSVDDLKKTFEQQYQNSLKANEKEAADLDQELRILQESTISRGGPVPLRLERGKAQTVVLRSPDPKTGVMDTKVVSITVKRISGPDGKEILSLEENGVPVEVQTGATKQLSDIPWDLTAHAIEKHWFSESVITLSLSPRKTTKQGTTSNGTAGDSKGGKGAS